MTDLSPTSDQPPLPSRDKDSRDIVTTYAFEVDPKLLGKPIARPWRRAVAQVIDLILIALLSQLSSIFLALLTAFAFLRASRRNNPNIQSTVARRVLRFAGTILLFITTIIIVEAMRNTEPPEKTEKPVSQAIVYGVHLIGWNQCDGDYVCLSGMADGAGETFAEAGVTRDEVEDHIDDLLNDTDVSAEQKSVILTRYLTAFDQTVIQASGSTDSPTETPPPPLPEIGEESPFSEQPGCDCADNRYLPLQWLEKWIKDLGQGIGWAALYHTLFIAWFRGRTPGKKLLKIRIVKLDGSDFSLWESFGRYGGYGAGFATGLLGFIQIYWDANRQAIQDKIAETVVIYEK